MRRESPIHAILNPPDKQSSNNNSSCTLKETIKYQQSLLRLHLPLAIAAVKLLLPPLAPGARPRARCGRIP
jgi:hypothetical protein